MKINGNTFASSFVYTPNRDASELHYGPCPLMFLGDSGSGSNYEIGYNASYVDMGTRFLFYTPAGISGLSHLSDPTLVYMPSLVSGLDDVPTAVGVENMSWVEDSEYGRVFSSDGSIDTYWDLGPMHKSVNIHDDESFMIEAIVKPNTQIGAQKIINLGYDETLNHGLRLNIHTFTTLSFGWGDGITVNSLSSSSIETGKWQHIAVVWRKDKDELTLYRNGLEVNSISSPSALYQENTYSGLADLRILEELDGDAALVKVSVGEYTPSDFAYHFYAKDNQANYQAFPYNLKKDSPYSIYLDWNSGARETFLKVTNNLSSDLVDYSIRIETSAYTNADAVSFEQLDGSPLTSLEYDGVFFVKIPLLLADSSITIKLVEGESLSIKPRSIARLAKFSDDMLTKFGGYNPQKWQELAEDGIDRLVNYSLYGSILSGRVAVGTLYEGDSYTTGDRLEAYLMANPGFAYTSGYRLLFKQGRVATDAGIISGVFGVCIEAEMYSGFSSCLNYFIDDQEGTRGYGGSFAHADWKNYHKGALGAQDSSVRNNSEQFATNSFEVIVNASTDELSVKNLTSGNEHTSIDLSAEIPGYTDTRGYFGFVWGNEGFNFDSHFTSYFLSNFIALDYVNNEPTVTELNSVNKKHQFRLYINGEQQL